MPRFALRRPKGLLALAGIGLVTAAVIGAQAPRVQPSKDDEHTLRIVAALLERNHFSKPTINDEISRRWCRNFLKALDPMKYHFLKADVDEFLKQENELDDTIATGKLDFEKLVFDRFLKRNDERYADAMEILNQPADFTVDESIGDDPEHMKYPADAAEAKDRLRKLIKLDLLRLKLIKTEETEARKQLVIRYRDQHRYYGQFENIEVLERYITALTTAIDPHSTYMGPKQVEDMMQQLHKTLDGIGASLLSVDGYPTVQDVVEGGAAFKDGRLQVDDKIVGVVNADGSRESFVEKKLDDVVRKIRGERGTKVKIIVLPAEQIDEAKKDKKDKPEEKVYELTRQKIDLNDEKAKGQVIDFKAPGSDRSRKFGILSIPSFYGDSQAMNNGEADAASTTRDCRRILENFKAKGVESVVVDLRGNPGGLLDEAISLSGLFIDKGPVVQVREAQAGTTHQDDLDEGTAWDGPLVMVIDHFCASASEILAGVIKDYGRGLIVGDSSTYGKGTVQNIVPLGQPGIRFRGAPKFGALKLTIRQFYLPNGDSTQIRGVASDLHIPSFGDVSDYGESRSETALKFDRVAPLPHDQYNRIPADLLAKVTGLSDARRKANPKFQEEEKYLKKYLERKQRHEISLNEAKFKAETRADEEVADEAKPKDKKKGKKSSRRAEMTWEPGYYNDEVLAITNDYLTLGSRVLAAAPVRANNNEAPPLRP